MDKGKSGRYAVMLLLSGILGGVLSLFGGGMAIIRGVILGLSLTLPIPLIDIFLVAKGRDAVWKAALIGGGCGMVGGVVMWGLQYLRLGWYFSAINQIPAVFLLIPPVYGLLVHAAYRFSRRRGYGLLRTVNLLLAAGLVAGFIRFYPLYWPMPNGAAVLEGIILALEGSLGTVPVFILLWGVGVCCFEGQTAKRCRDWIFLVLELVIFVIVAFFGSMTIGLGYNRMVFEHRTADDGMLRLLPDAIMTGDKLVTANGSIVLPTDYRGQRAFLLAVRRNMVVVYNKDEKKIEVRRDDGTLLLSSDDRVAVALAPSGTRLAVLSGGKDVPCNRFELVRFYRLPDGGKIGEATGTFYRQCCWSRDERFLFLEHYDDKADAVQRVEKLVVATGEIVPFAAGTNPDLILGNGKIAYRRGEVIYCRTPEGGPEQRLCRLNLGVPQDGDYGSFAVSPDGKMVVYMTSIWSPLEPSDYYVLYDLASERKCRLDTGTDWPSALQWLRPEDYDTAVTFAFGNSKGKKK
ncbi:MAG: hypothetical protein PHQ27_06785 [Victivallales bacterium]|nr:hypothetical protein [Victivallales bacterium]